MHAVIRLVVVVVFATALAWASPLDLLLSTVVLGVSWIGWGAGAWEGTWRMMRRLRWFWLSIVIFYGWFTPGTPLLEGGVPAAWWPTQEGLTQGGIRLTALLLTVLAVQLMIATTPRSALVAALLYLARPFSYVGLDTTRFAARVALTLHAVPTAQARLAALPYRTVAGSPWTRVGILTAQAYTWALAQAEEEISEVTMEVAPVTAPPPWQWPPPSSGGR